MMILNELDMISSPLHPPLPPSVTVTLAMSSQAMTMAASQSFFPSLPLPTGYTYLPTHLPPYLQMTYPIPPYRPIPNGCFLSLPEGVWMGWVG
jgi:hypothetical protein